MSVQQMHIWYIYLLFNTKSPKFKKNILYRCHNKYNAYGRHYATNGGDRIFVISDVNRGKI